MVLLYQMGSGVSHFYASLMGETPGAGTVCRRIETDSNLGQPEPSTLAQDQTSSRPRLFVYRAFIFLSIHYQSYRWYLCSGVCQLLVSQVAARKSVASGENGDGCPSLFLVTDGH